MSALDLNRLIGKSYAASECRVRRGVGWGKGKEG